MTGDSGAATARALSALPTSSWRAMHDVQWPGRRMASIEHLVVGPPGVFVIASLGVRSEPSPHGDLMREAALARVADCALAIGERFGIDPTLVTPVLCVSGGTVAVGHARGVLVCSTLDLVQVLQSQEEVLLRVHVDEVFARLQEGMPSATYWAGAHSSGRESSGFGGPRQPSRPVDTQVVRREKVAKPLPWEPGTEVSPAMTTKGRSGFLATSKKAWPAVRRTSRRPRVIRTCARDAVSRVNSLPSASRTVRRSPMAVS